MSDKRVASELTVAILPFRDVSLEQVTLTAEVLQEEFGVKTVVLPAMEMPAECFNAVLNQYQLVKVVNFLFHQLPANTQRIVGIVNGDLGIEEKDGRLRLSLGYADPHSKAAIYGASNILEQQSHQQNNKLGEETSRHLIIHEFAHTFSIKHCVNPECAMNKGGVKTTLCDHCRRWADRELRVKPGSAEELFSRAESLLRHNCLRQAIITYHEAISSAPNEPLYHTRLAKALFKVRLNKLADDQIALAAIMAKDATNYDYICGIACIDFNLEHAEESFAKAIASTTDPQLMHRLIGQAYREIIHDVERASRHYLEYLRLGGDDPDVVDWLVSRSKLDKP